MVNKHCQYRRTSALVDGVVVYGMAGLRYEKSGTARLATVTGQLADVDIK